MAYQMEAEYEERGVIFLTIVIDDSPDPDTTVSWTDAQWWAYNMDFDGDGTREKQHGIVLADIDGVLWKRYVDQCEGLSDPAFTECRNSCWVTPQHQVFDQGGMTVDDRCARPVGGGSYSCQSCGYDQPALKAVLDAMLPPKWCGEATP